jgi:hypothetical protein
MRPLSAGCHAALLGQVAGGDQGGHLRDRHAGAARAGLQRSPGDASRAGAVDEGLLGAAAHLHHVRGFQEDRTEKGLRCGSIQLF